MGFILFVPEDSDNQAIPFNTQFFHDDFDNGNGPRFDGDGSGQIGSAAPGVEGDKLDLMVALAGSLRRVRPQYANYVKRVKHVDVRNLQENIWKSLDIKVLTPKNPDESMVCTFQLFCPFVGGMTDCTFFSLIRMWTTKMRTKV